MKYYFGEYLVAGTALFLCVWYLVSIMYDRFEEVVVPDPYGTPITLESSEMVRRSREMITGRECGVIHVQFDNNPYAFDNRTELIFTAGEETLYHGPFQERFVMGIPHGDATTLRLEVLFPKNGRTYRSYFQRKRYYHFSANEYNLRVVFMPLNRGSADIGFFLDAPPEY
ncbi:hypothetical protein [Acanthopleuribacter pedis]|uniref:Uncharacterized protein n=1 Tax=Acanthopleuribacter pedis TaxID=442870 RepID=A0A8J7QN35_9BACT|nr:hypothetical protein [Acanthopleuribacter pedis]MBO1321040.1 hypothetical protein [Acanthopleuribacter pedis]